MSELRAGVVGLGTMGRHHARVLAGLAGVRLVGACDPDPGAGSALRTVPVFPDLDRLLELDLDLCVVAAPTLAHAAIGSRLAAAGVHTLIEKPLAASAEEARILAAQFERAGLVGCVGHIERFNPVVRAMRERIGGGEVGTVLQITTSRQGPYPQRIRDVGVILDLASHDIDLTRWIAGAPYVKVSAVTSRVTGASGHEDLAAVVGVLQDGTVVNHLVNWLSPVKRRLVSVTGELGSLRGDLLTGTLWFNGHDGGVAVPGPGGPVRVPGGRTDRSQVVGPEPLAAELEGFVAAVRGHAGVVGDAADVVPMQAGAEVMDVTAAILAQPAAVVEVSAATGPADAVRSGPVRVAAQLSAPPGADRVAALLGAGESQTGGLPVLVAGYVPAPGSRRWF
ncbi:Gfo/Idh/MocA family oxidoreductase [Streptacidiphilus sp. EB129]|uniref:Gfo/Idh/MocA family oxidoreductase n=1 Tax=Streptacidiphilus sp. EB129 TaxID=3156262 RepID=UPI003516C8CD